MISSISDIHTASREFSIRVFTCESYLDGSPPDSMTPHPQLPVLLRDVIVSMSKLHSLTVFFPEDQIEKFQPAFSKLPCNTQKAPEVQVGSESWKMSNTGKMSAISSGEDLLKWRSNPCGSSSE